MGRGYALHTPRLWRGYALHTPRVRRGYALHTPRVSETCHDTSLLAYAPMAHTARLTGGCASLTPG